MKLRLTATNAMKAVKASRLVGSIRRSAETIACRYYDCIYALREWLLDITPRPRPLFLLALVLAAVCGILLATLGNPSTAMFSILVSGWSAFPVGITVWWLLEWQGGTIRRHAWLRDNFSTIIPVAKELLANSAIIAGRALDLESDVRGSLLGSRGWEDHCHAISASWDILNSRQRPNPIVAAASSYTHRAVSSSRSYTSTAMIREIQESSKRLRQLSAAIESLSYCEEKLPVRARFFDSQFPAMSRAMEDYFSECRTFRDHISLDFGQLNETIVEACDSFSISLPVARSSLTLCQECGKILHMAEML
jgi:hypothetical protein